ncbi:hypothetical protein EAH79_01420 [Sphingomonas koreensis]|nr:hypothetical protein EAH79_01420 [Sphingomonas koreensis]
MRRDARDLLDKLGRRDVRYRQFVDSTTDMELWPIFEALLRDDRVIGADWPTQAEPHGGLVERRPASDDAVNSAGRPIDPFPDAREAPAAASKPAGSSLFGNYEPTGRPVMRPSTTPRAQSIRNFLSHLSDDD